jgi:hypothetical protein
MLAFGATVCYKVMNHSNLVSTNLPFMLLILLLLLQIPTRINLTFSVGRGPTIIFNIPEQVIIVPLRSVVTLSVDIVETNGKDELLSNDLVILRVVKLVVIGVSIRAVPMYEGCLSNVL